MWENTYELGELLSLTNARLGRIPGLADTTPFSERTFYYYVQQGLLPRRAGRRGPGTRYPASFIDRLIAIRRLQKTRGLSLAEIRVRLAQASEDGLRAMAAGEPVEALPLAAMAEPQDSLCTNEGLEGLVADDEYDQIPELTSPVTTPMKDLLDIRDAEREAGRELGRTPSPAPPQSATHDEEAGESMCLPPRGAREETEVGDKGGIPAFLRRKTASSDRHPAHHFPLGEDAELVIHRPLTPRQARQLESVQALLRTILEDDGDEAP